MPKSIWLCAAGALLLLAISSNADAKTSRAISTDGSMQVPAIVGTPNSDVMTMFILSGPGSSDDYISAGGQRIFCNKSFTISASDSCTANSPGDVFPLGSTGPYGEWPIGSPLISDQPSAPSARTDFGQVQFILTNFDTLPPTTLFSASSSFEDGSLGQVFGGQSHSIYADMVTDLANFDFGVLDPTIAATLSALPASNNLQFIGWQDSNVSEGFDPNADANKDVDPWTYNNMVMAVWFVPRTSAPEPASLLLFAPALLGASYLARRRRVSVAG
jgi:hypothetical protein